MTPADLAELARLGDFFDRVWAAATEDRAEIARLKARIKALEAAPPVKPPEPGLPDSPSKWGLAVIPFTEPPLLRNKGSWDNSDYNAWHGILTDGSFEIGLSQSVQKTPRRVRHDFGLQRPDLAPGRGGFLREPTGKLRRYEVKIGIPENYDSSGGMCNLFQLHTHAAKMSPYLVFMLRTANAYVRHVLPDGTRHDFDLGLIEEGHEYHVSVIAKWSKGSSGVLVVGVDGKPAMDYAGANYREDEEFGPYLLLGPDYPSAEKAFKATFTYSDLKAGDI